MSPGHARIGELAAQCGVSTRTLRYYEQLGLLSPAAHSPGGARRYGEEAEARVRRIRELQELMAFDLDEIRTVLSAEDRLAELRSEFRSGHAPRERQEQILREAMDINDRLRREIKEKLSRAQRFLDELETKARRYRAAVRDLDRPDASDRSADLRRERAGVRLGP
jgi:MerR family transcriptional regulator, repressor of the yfmOP operon